MSEGCWLNAYIHANTTVKDHSNITWDTPYQLNSWTYLNGVFTLLQAPPGLYICTLNTAQVGGAGNARLLLNCGAANTTNANTLLVIPNTGVTGCCTVLLTLKAPLDITAQVTNLSGAPVTLSGLVEGNEQTSLSISRIKEFY